MDRDRRRPARALVRLGFDATSLGPEGRGLARVQAELLAAVAEHDLVEELVAFVADDAGELPQCDRLRVVPVRTAPMLRWEQLGLPLAARRERVDVVLTLSERAALFGAPRVMYVYEHPRHRAQRNRETGASMRQRIVDVVTLALFPLARARAAFVAASSRSTANEIGADAVVYSGVSGSFSPGPATERSAYLHLASDDPRENTETVLRALALLDSARLVVAGGMRSTLAEKQALAASLGVADRVEWRGFLSSEELVEAYRDAIAYVDPSLYEGFGLQAAEALACGTPAIASNTTSLPEVVGDGGILLDPYDVQGFADAMRRVRDEPGLREELSRKAIAQAAGFTWEQTARALVALCRERRATAAAGS
jgi:glycosyltransferase involved in cell wall biosynthesis